MICDVKTMMTYFSKSGSMTGRNAIKWMVILSIHFITFGDYLSGAYACVPVTEIHINAPNGTIATRLRNLPPCISNQSTSSCRSFNVIKAVISFANRTTYNPKDSNNPIAICSHTSPYAHAIENSFCWNQTDHTIRVTSLLGVLDFLKGSDFLYTIEVNTAVGIHNCYLHLKVRSFSTTATAYNGTSTQILPTTFHASPTAFLNTTKSNNNPTTTGATTQKPEIDVKILDSDVKEVKTELKDGSNKVELQCQCTLNSSDFRRITSFWMKDGLSLNELRNEMTFRASNLTDTDSKGLTRMKLILTIDVTRSFVQGHYRCAISIDGRRTLMGNETLLWLEDVSSTKLEVETTPSSQKQLENRISISLDEFESVYNVRLSKRLKLKRLKRDKFDLYIRHNPLNATRNNSKVLFDVLYRDVDIAEKLRICKMISRENRSSIFSLTSLDCCVASTTGTNSSNGEIDWPMIIHGTQVDKKCPFSRKSDGLLASRFCNTDFIKGPYWEAPQTTSCPEASKTTKKLKKLSEEKIDKNNKKSVMRTLRQLTKNPKNLTSELDFELSTEVMEKVLNVSDNQNEVLDDVLGTTSDLMNGNESLILSSQQNSNTSTRLLKLLEKLSDEVQVNATLTDEQENIAIGINLFDENDIQTGLKIHGIMNKTTNFPQIKFSIASSLEKSLMTYVYLSSATLRKINKEREQKRTKLTSFLFNKPVLFESAYDNTTDIRKKRRVNGKILSLAINGRRVQDLNGDEEIQNYFKPNSSEDLEKISCVYWNFKAKDGRGDWSSKGCRKIGMKNGMFLCKCNHMTNFAILLEVSARKLSRSEAQALSFVSYIGCGISLLSLIITIATLASSRKLRQSRPNKILLCLSSSLVMTMIIFLGGSLSSKFAIACQIVAALLHFFVLASFCWMVVEAFNIYQSFIIVLQQGTSRFMLKANIFAWGTPFVVVLITNIIAELKDYKKSGSENWICVLGGLPFYVAYLSPISLILLGNLIVLTITMFSLGRQSSYGINKNLDRKAKTKIAIIFSVLLGCTWVFGLVAVEDLKFTFQLLFCIFNSLQGFFIFVFFCLRSEDVRAEWKRLFCKCRSEDRTDTLPTKKRESESRCHTVQLNDWRSESQKTLTS